MGVVSEALDRQTGMLVALKTIQTPGPHALYRLKKEFRLAQDLQHENLVTLGELVEHEGTWFFTMELLDGIDFYAYVRGRSTHDDELPPSPERADYDEARLRDALAQLLRGLDALHSRDLVHRDVKPSNVMVTTEGRVVLLDFGLATVAAHSMQSVADNVVGTAQYMAPEQAAGRPVSPKSDMYAVGVMLYEALTGRAPIEGNLLQVLLSKQSEDLKPPSTLARVPEDLELLCMELLRSDPEQRPDAAKALVRIGADPGPGRALSTSQLLSDSGNVWGREAEWQALQKLLHDARERGARAVLVRGKSGLGKTTLVHAFCREAAHDAEPALVLSGRCYEREDTPYRGFDAAIDELSRHLRQLPDGYVSAMVPRDAYVLTRLFPVLGRVAAIARGKTYAGEGGDDQHRRTRAFECLRAILNELSRRGPIILFIDDIQWADGDGITLLSDLMQGEDAPRVLWLLAARAGPEHEHADAPLSQLRAALGSRLEELEIGRLSADASLALARELLARVSPEAIAAAEDIVREADGHPLHIAELVQYAALNGWSSSTPPRLEDAIWARVGQLPVDATSALSVVCVAGAPISPELIARVTGMPSRGATRVMAMLRVAQLARWTPQGRVEPYHERVRDAVTQRLSHEHIRELHARLADVLETEPDRHDLLVHHLRALGDAVRTAQLARQAAERAVAALAFDRAASLYRTALDMDVSSESETRSLRLALARALMNMGRCAMAADEFLRAAEGADPEVRLEAQRLAAQQLIVSGHVERGLEVASTLLNELGLSLPKTPRAALCSLLYNRLRLRLRGLAYQERRAGQISREQINLVEVFRAVGQGLALVDNIRGADFNARFLLRALELGNREHLAQAIGSEATYQGSQGPKALAHARELARMLHELCEVEDDAYYKAWSTAVSGALDHFDGHFVRAEKREQQAIEIFRSGRPGYTWELNTAIMFRFFAMRHVGVMSTLRVEVERELREAERRGDRYIETSLRRYCNCLWLAQDDAEGALRNLSSSPWAPPEGRYHMQHWYELEARSELDLYQGTVPEKVDEVIARFAPFDASMLSRVQALRDISTWLKARCLLASPESSEQKRRLRLAEGFAQKLERGGSVPAQAWAGLLLGAIHSARGRKEESASVLARSVELADERSMRLVSAAARMRLGQVLADDRGRELAESGVRDMQSAGVINPSRYVRIVAPGFPEVEP